MGTKTGKTIKPIHFATRNNRPICNLQKSTFDITDTPSQATCKTCISMLKDRGMLNQNFFSTQETGLKPEIKLKRKGLNDIDYEKLNKFAKKAGWKS